MSETLERRYREAELSPIVTAWLQGLGYAVYSEVPFSCSHSNIDHVGIRWADESIICIEMKCTFSAKVLYQACLRQLATPLVYVAVPTTPRTSSIEKAKRIGVGVFANGAVLLEPNGRQRVFSHYAVGILDYCRNAQEGGIGGMPTVKGDGPAIRVAAAVREYLATHPDASWKQIYREVPNHYAHARSMAGAIGSALPSRLARLGLASEQRKPTA